jgi:hypothetical protein
VYPALALDQGQILRALWSSHSVQQRDDGFDGVVELSQSRAQLGDAVG